MTEEARKLADFIQDRSNNRREFIFSLQDVKEITEIGRKIDRLLDELKENGIIISYEHAGNKVSVIIFEQIKKDYDEKTESNGGGTVDTALETNKAYERIHKRVINQFIKEKYQNFAGADSIFKAYSDLFQLFVLVTDDSGKKQETDNLFSFVRNQMDESIDENFIKIIGPDGTGKSTFLSLLYVYLYDCFCKGEISKYPFYVNLHYYDSKVTEADTPNELDKKVEEKIEKDLSELIAISEKCNSGFLIIIDGKDKYYRTQLKSADILDNMVKKIKGHKKIICLGEKTNVHSYRERKQNNSLDVMTTYTFRFSPIYITEKDKWKDAIEKYCHIIHKEKFASNISERIGEFNIKEIDYNLLTMLGYCTKYNLRDIQSISELYDKYCMDYLGNSSKRLDTSIDLAYWYFMTELTIEQKRISDNWKEWELVHQHKTISNYLLALYYARLILECKQENVKRLECVFTNGINVFLKSILNNVPGGQNKVIEFCEMTFRKEGYRAQAQVAYLVGRVKDKALRGKARNLLKKQLEHIGDGIEKEDERNCDMTIELQRERNFLRRSLLVSMLYLGDCDAGVKLIKNFFDYPLMNEVNRAFYLQYYDDVRLAPESVNLEDDGQNSILYTSGVLLNYVNRQLMITKVSWEKKDIFEFQIRLFTLCSLVQIRLSLEKEKRQKTGLDEALLDDVHKVISLTLTNVQSNLADEMRFYLQMLEEDIKNNSFSRGHLYKDLYSVKDIQRTGWLEKIKKRSIRVKRYENVAEHTYYAWLLGMLYLPEQVSSETEYSNDGKSSLEQYDKQKILDYLLIHDLAEWYIGDIPTEAKTQEDKEKENEAMRRIFMHDTYQSIQGTQGIAWMEKYRNIWKQFQSEPDNINGKIANEIDLIQAIYQFCVYKSEGADFKDGKEEEWKNERNKIKTSIGQKILNEVVIKNFKDIFPESNPDTEIQKD